MDAEECATEIEALDADAAVLMYAGDDVDGQSEGVYNHGETLMVRAEDGSLMRFEVTVEWEPSFFIVPMPLPGVDPVA